MINQKIVHLILAIALLATPKLTLAADLEEIKSRGKLIVAVKDNLRPLGFADPAGKLQGLEIDIARRLAEEILGSADAVILQPVTNEERLEIVMEGKVDLAIARVTLTASRNRLVDFSPYYYLDGTGLVTKSEQVKTLRDLATKKIAVLNNSSTIAVVNHELPNAQLIGVNSYQEALELLEAGKADGFAADQSLLTGWVQEYPQYRLLPQRLSGEALGIVMPKGLQYLELRSKVNEAIARWQKSGWLRERATYWGLP
ncbi:MAG: transporter substrate-binding domain-containing protein [Gomphosphaeria aponina SAG 52.96 = DSM 107014]|uniref:Transporter substrate-binding domain-containing protein n=1 Tax=Gomphosphaeria aponina SAG 52.96 = DSM 107014 TaxID=1521640 RepID=A0A941GQZ6_9CHRO|nr:transporter substrate-binding domain-containing protein [Gomphosphaeria aponina SAG 52.96 = DSM 107014]